MLEDPIQKKESDYYRPFHLFFYEKLFGAAADNEILSHEKWTKNTIKALLNEVFSLNIETNKNIAEDFVWKKNIKFGLKKWKILK